MALQPAMAPMLSAGLPLGLTAAVGLKGKNLPPDVIRIQDALNGIPVNEGAPATLLTLDGIAGPKTFSAIQQFQLRHVGMRGADGRVDPGGNTDRLMSKLLVHYGSTIWNIRRIESAVPAAGGRKRTGRSLDRIYEIADGRGVRRALYYFTPMSLPTPPRASDLPPLRSVREFNMFTTSCACGPFSFVGLGSYTEFSPDTKRAFIRITVQPVAAHVSAGPFNFQITHQWIEKMSTPGARVDITGYLTFIRDDSIGPRKVSKRG